MGSECTNLCSFLQARIPSRAPRRPWAARRLTVTTGNVSAVLARRRQHPEGCRVDVDDEERTFRVGYTADLLGSCLHNTQIARILDVDRRRLLGDLFTKLLEIHRPSDGIILDVDDVEPVADVVEHHLQPVRVDVLGQHDLRRPVTREAI